MGIFRGLAAGAVSCARDQSRWLMPAPNKESFMQIIKIAAAVALLAGAATLAFAQTTPPANAPEAGKAQPGAPDQAPGKQTPSTDTGVGSRPIGPPTGTEPARGNNPTGESKEKRKSDQDDPSTGGKKN